MKERPIPFTAPMVQAILDGRKTMTRRIIKFPKEDMFSNLDQHRMYEPVGDYLTYKGVFACDFWHSFLQDLDDHLRIKCPYGDIGDQLWVRETFTIDLFGRNVYRATDGDLDGVGRKFTWTSSRFMSRAASRINLLIKSIRVERLQDISEEDAEREGVFIHKVYPSPRMEFANLWESINGKGSWDANPWVWVIKFERIEP